ncbi:hypothetical protein ScPMuIL_014770 [Solemya velum]
MAISIITKKAKPENMELLSPFSILWRFYVYAVHGYFAEIMFTAIWEFVDPATPKAANFLDYCNFIAQ